MLADFKCCECGNVQEYNKPTNETFSEVMTLYCSNCKKACTFKRLYTPIPFDVAAGKCGNAENGYSSNAAHFSGTYTPGNKRGWGHSGEGIL